MGKMIYETGGAAVDVEDRALAHLQIVIGSKLRRGESFFYSWRNDVSVGSGRNSVWIHPHMHLVFRYSGGRAPHLNARWIEVLGKVANTPTGLHLTSEPEDIPNIARTQDFTAASA